MLPRVSLHSTAAHGLLVVIPVFRLSHPHRNGVFSFSRSRLRCQVMSGNHSRRPHNFPMDNRSTPPVRPLDDNYVNDSSIVVHAIQYIKIPKPRIMLGRHINLAPKDTRSRPINDSVHMCVCAYPE